MKTILVIVCILLGLRWLYKAWEYEEDAALYAQIEHGAVPAAGNDADDFGTPLEEMMS